MAGRGGGGAGGGQEARRRGLRLASPTQDGGVDSGLGTCSPTSEDRGLASTLGVAESVDWLEAVVERLQTVFVVRGERERRVGGGRRRSRRKVRDGEVEEREARKKEECISATGEKVHSLSGRSNSRQRIAQYAPTGEKDNNFVSESDKTGKNSDLGSQESMRSVSRVRRVSLDQRRGSFGGNRSSEPRLQAAKSVVAGKSREKTGKLTREGERSEARCEKRSHRASSQIRRSTKLTDKQNHDQLFTRRGGDGGSFKEQRLASQKVPLRKVLSEKSYQRSRRRKNEERNSGEHKKDFQGCAKTRPEECNVAKMGSRKSQIDGERGKGSSGRSARNDTCQTVDCHDAGREDGGRVSELGSRGGSRRSQKYGGRSASEHGRRGSENGRRRGENGRIRGENGSRESGDEGERRKGRKGERIHFSSSSNSSGEESEKQLPMEVERGGGGGMERESRRRSNEEVFDCSENLLSPSDAYIRTRRDSTSPMWWDERFQGGTGVGTSWRKSRRGSEVNAVLMRKQSLSYNMEQESQADLSRRYSYFLDFIDDLCSGATCSDPGRSGGASGESENQGWAGQRARQPSSQSHNLSSWGSVKHRLVLSSELLKLGRECSLGHPEVAMQCRSNYPVIGPKEFLLLHSACPQPTHKDSPDLWYRFLQL